MDLGINSMLSLVQDARAKNEALAQVFSFDAMDVLGCIVTAIINTVCISNGEIVLSTRDQKFDSVFFSEMSDVNFIMMNPIWIKHMTQYKLYEKAAELGHFSYSTTSAISILTLYNTILAELNLPSMETCFIHSLTMNKSLLTNENKIDITKAAFPKLQNIAYSRLLAWNRNIAGGLKYYDKLLTPQELIDISSYVALNCHFESFYMGQLSYYSFKHKNLTPKILSTSNVIDVSSTNNNKTTNMSIDVNKLINCDVEYYETFVSLILEKDSKAKVRLINSVLNDKVILGIFIGEEEVETIHQFIIDEIKSNDDFVNKENLIDKKLVYYFKIEDMVYSIDINVLDGNQGDTIIITDGDMANVIVGK